MKKLLITYHMENQTETAETCITLPMQDDIADDILTKGADNSAMLKDTLKHIAALQGYRYAGFCSIELVEETNCFRYAAGEKQLDKAFQDVKKMRQLGNIFAD